jgi:hypothetical protein
MTGRSWGILVACVTVVLVGTSLAAEPDEAKQAAPVADVQSDAEIDAPADTDSHVQQDPRTGKGVTALAAAAKADKYLFALFFKEDNQQTEQMRAVLAATLPQISDRAQAVEVDVSLESEKLIVDRFGLRWAPSPLLLSIAPNGVIVAGFPTRVQAEDILDAFASPATERLLKALEERKLVFLCVQNAKSEQRKAANRGVRQFKRDERFAEGTEIIRVDPADKAEAELLESLQVDPETSHAVTVFFGPRGRPIGEFHGETSIDDLVHALSLSMSGFG